MLEIMSKRRLGLLIVLGPTLILGCGGDTPRAERQRLAGVWRIVAFTDDGVVIPKQARPSFDVTITDQHFHLNSGTRQLKSAYEVRPGTSPKTIDLIAVPEKPAKDQEARPHLSHGIYELEGTRLRICIAGPPKARPTEFTSTPGSGRMLIVLEREK
jgi:uncharacterized protein (TIGR03067 family)